MHERRGALQRRAALESHLITGPDRAALHDRRIDTDRRQAPGEQCEHFPVMFGHGAQDLGVGRQRALGQHYGGYSCSFIPIFPPDMIPD